MKAKHPNFRLLFMFLSSRTSHFTGKYQKLKMSSVDLPNFDIYGLHFLLSIIPLKQKALMETPAG